MIRNYFIIAFRTLARAKVLSFINIFGLSLGIGTAILIILFVKDELTFDSFHSKAERIYRPWVKSVRGEREMISTATPFSMGRQLQENYEDVEKNTVYTSFNDKVEKNDISFNENINIASSQFFEMFDFKLLSGSTLGALKDPKDVIITREIAIKYFSDIDVSGESLTIHVGGEPREFEVRAVMENVPTNSSIRFEMIVSDHFLKDVFPETMLTSWFMITGENFLLLKEGADPETTSAKFSSLIEQVLGEQLQERTYDINLQPIQDIHLNTELPPANAPVSNPKYIYILAGIALLILVIASINFVTLSLGRSVLRAKEIGIRKSVGALRSQLMAQFMGEALIVVTVSLLFGIVLAFLTLPLFNTFSGKELVFDISIQNIAIFIGLMLGVGLTAGFYPALVMSRFKPVSILKGNLKVGSGRQSLRTILLAGQFILSIFLVSATLIMKDQLGYLQNKYLGFDKEHVIVVPLNVTNARGLRDQVSQGIEKGEQLKRVLQSDPSIVDIAMASHTFEPGNWTSIGWQAEGDMERSFFFNTVTVDYIKTLGINLLNGRDFSRDYPADARRSVIVNEAFVKEFNLSDPIGARIPDGNFDDHEIIGVVKDFHIESLHTRIQPLVLGMNVNTVFSGAQRVEVGSSVIPKVFVRVAPGKTDDVLQAIRNAWVEVYPDEPFDYHFLDDRLKEQYEREQNLGKIMTSATILAVIIGCMGLFGLSALSFAARVKEVGIRKVLGASSNNLMITLLRSFVILIAVALIIASPLTWIAMDNWLNEFEYRVVITPVVFFLAGALTLLVSLLTIIYQTIRVLRTNPSEVLRTE